MVLPASLLLLQFLWFPKHRIDKVYGGLQVLGIGALTHRQAALIAACLPNPKKYTVKPISGYVAVKSNWVQRQMRVLEKDPDVLAIVR